MIALAGGDRALFASDMHLGDHDPATAAWFVESLHRQASGCSHLFLLGDLFEVWVGDDQADPASQALQACLAGLSGSGLVVSLMRGNRDFLLDTGSPRFSTRCGVQLLDDPVVIDLFGRRVLLTHGDALCVDDVEYQRFRAQSRSPEWQRTLLAQPLAQRLALARQLRERSETEKLHKADYLMDVNDGQVAQSMVGQGVDLMIHGHTHRPADHEFMAGGRRCQRLVLPDWDARAGRGGFLCVDAQGWRRLAP